MFPYLLTFIYILGICILSSGEAKYFSNLESLTQIKNEENEMRCYVKSLTAQSNYSDFVNAKQGLEATEKHTSVKNTEKETPSSTNISYQKRNKSLNIDLLRPPDNSRINLHALLLEPEALRREEFSWFSILSRLIVQEYLTKDILSEYTLEDVNRLLLAIIENKQLLWNLSLDNSSPDLLLQISLENKRLSNLLNHLLVGGEDFSSILCFLDCTPKKSLGFYKLNFLFLDRSILTAIFSNSAIVDSLQEVQQNFFREILEREEIFRESSSDQVLKTRTEFKLELKEAVLTLLLKNQCNSLIDRNIFDFSLGKKGSYFLIKKAQNHCISRFRYFYPENKWIERTS